MKYLQMMNQYVNELGNREYIWKNIDHVYEPSSRQHKFSDVNGNTVTVDIQDSPDNTLRWRIREMHLGKLPEVYSGSVSRAKDLRSFKRRLILIVSNLGRKSIPKLIDPKGRWIAKFSGAIVVLFVFTGIKTFAVLQLEPSGSALRRELVDGMVEWQQIISHIGPGGLGEVVLGSMVFNPPAGLSCLALGSIAILFWTTPIRQKMNDIVSLWGLVLIIVPIFCIIIAIVSLPWTYWLPMVMALVAFASARIFAGSSTTRFVRWGVLAREYRMYAPVSDAPERSWQIEVGSEKPIELTISQIARYVELHSTRCEKYAAQEDTGTEAPPMYSFMIARAGGELLKAYAHHPFDTPEALWSRALRSSQKRDLFEKVCFFLIGQGLLLTLVVCVAWLMLDPTPWQPMICAEIHDGVVGYTLSDDPTLFLDEATRTPILLDNQEVQYVNNNLECE